MHLIECASCGNEISPKAEVCPKCGHPNEKAKKLSFGTSILYLLLGGATFWYFVGGGLDEQVSKDIAKIEDEVAKESVAQYEIAKKQGDPIQTCVQAGFVSAAYLQANDSDNYNAWKEIEELECKLAGVPR